MQRKSNSVFDKLSVFNEEGELNVIVDTPKGSRNKYKFDEDLGLFRLGGVLPVGHFFPFDFGYVPNTLGGDGDPLDVLILMDEPAFVGCLIPSRLVGVIEAKQTEDGKTEVNHRLIAVAAGARAHTDVKSLNDLNKTLVDEIEHFFVSYNEAKGKKFEPTARAGAQRAKKIVEAGITLRKQSGKTKNKPRKK
jgi:inorganic pyrophosphatase